MEIRSLASTGIDELFTAWTAAFKDYIRTWTRSELEHMLLRRGYVPSLSFGAFEQGNLVSFTLNAVGSFKGQLTAYDTGTATVASHRGQGLATQIFRYALPYLREAGVTQYLLEVIQSNVNAIAIYKNIGFEITRELDYFMEDRKALHLDYMLLPQGVGIKEIDLSFQQVMEEMSDFTLSWQNSFESMSRSASNLKIAGAFYDNQLVGYGIIEPMSGDIPQLAIGKKFRRKKIGSALLAWLLRHNSQPSVKIINIESGYKDIHAFLEHTGIARKGGQYEMILHI